MYAKCESMLEAWQVFAIRQARSLIEWTSLISGYAQNGETVKKTFSIIMVSNIVSWNALKRGYRDHGYAEGVMYQFWTDARQYMYIVYFNFNTNGGYFLWNLKIKT